MQFSVVGTKSRSVRAVIVVFILSEFVQEVYNLDPAYSIALATSVLSL